MFQNWQITKCKVPSQVSSCGQGHGIVNNGRFTNHLPNVNTSSREANVSTTAIQTTCKRQTIFVLSVYGSFHELKTIKHC